MGHKWTWRQSAGRPVSAGSQGADSSGELPLPGYVYITLDIKTRIPEDLISMKDQAAQTRSVRSSRLTVARLRAFRALLWATS
jgi:hypothetical protein